MLSALFGTVDLWVTHYAHVMDSAENIRDMMRSTALKPHRAALKNGEYEKFEQAILEGIKEAYPVRPDGKVLYPFIRLFAIAR